MASLAVRMSVVNCEAFTSPGIESAVSREIPGGCTGRKEWIATFRTEEMLRMVGALAKPVSLAERDVVLFRDCSLTMVASRGEFLKNCQGEKSSSTRHELTS